MQILHKFGFEIDFFSWIKTILKNQESKYFKLERGARQVDPIPAYFLILVSEIFFIFVKNNPEIKGLNIFKNEFLYTAYVDDTNFFLKDRNYIIEFINELNAFSKPNKTKC